MFFVLLSYFIPLSGGLVPSIDGTVAVAAFSNAIDDPIAFQGFPAVSKSAWQSLYFLFAPLAVSLYALQLERDDLRLALPLVLGIGTTSGILGVLQLAGTASGSLYFYSITNIGSAVGFFANRNHSAVFLACLFPLLAVFASIPRSANPTSSNVKRLFAIAISILLVPLILVTGSRSGMLSAILGLTGGALLYVKSASSNVKSKMGVPITSLFATSAIFCLVFATIYFSRAEAIDRVFAENGIINDRSEFWSSSLQLFGSYFPFGFGPGGFVTAFQIVEPLDMLGGAYLNRLHNDWLETVLTFGVPGILMILAGTIYYLRRSFVLWVRMNGERSVVAMGRMASIVIAILAVASVSDYPLRTPAMSGFAALVLVWFAHARHDTNAR